MSAYGTIELGCAGLPPQMARADYWRSASFLELTELEGQTPRQSVLAGWRKDAPDKAQFSVVTHKDLGLLADTPAANAAWDYAVASAATLGAQIVLLRTAAAFTPTEVNKDALLRRAAMVLPDTFTLAWEPAGFWSRDEQRALCEKAGMVPAYDPLQPEEDPIVCPRAYLRLRGLGISKRRVAVELDLLADLAQSYEQTWVVFQGGGALPHVRSLGRLIQGDDDSE